MIASRLTQFFTVLAIAIALSVAGCRNEDVGSPIIISDIETEFTIDLLETAAFDSRALILSLETVKEDSCHNSSIDVECELIAGKFEVILKDINEPIPCIGPPTPAYRQLNCGVFSESSYPVTISLKNIVTNSGRLYVNDYHYKLIMDSKNGLQLLHEELLRIPNNVIWGGVTAYSSLGEDARDQLYLDLKTMATTYNGDPGYYGYFTLDGRGITLRNPLPAGNTTEVLLQYKAGSWEDLHNLVARYRNQYADDLYIRLTSGGGEVF